MDRLSFFTLVEELDALLQPNSAAFRFDTLTTAKKVAIALYFLKDTGSLRMTANQFQFGVAKSTVSARPSIVILDHG